MSGRAERGFILVAVLWMLAALAALASAYEVFALNTAASAYLPQVRVRVEAAIRSAVELAAYRQLSWPGAIRPDRGAFSTRLGAARIDVAYRSESARVDINAARQEVLAGVFRAAGAPDSVAGFTADRIVGWRSRLNESDKRSEVAIYRKAKLSYTPLGIPFDNILELALLPNMSPALLARALPLLTVYNGTGRIDPLIADPKVIAAFPGLTPKIVSSLRAAASEQRPSADAVAQIAGPAKDFIALDRNDKIRAQIVVTFPDRQVAAEVVLTVKDNAPEPYEILYWRDDFDGETTGG